MGERSQIEWTDATWNPVRGCSKVSEGCRNCYAMGVAARFAGVGQTYEGLAKRTPHGPEWTNQVMLVQKALDLPRSWREPKRVFVNSMSDLFHEQVPDDFILSVFCVMGACQRHTFQILTKRPERMRKWLRDRRWHNLLPGHPPARAHWVPNLPGEKRGGDSPFLPNVWLGVSVEDQAAANERIPHLAGCAAAVRFLSCEPLLGPVDLNEVGGDQWGHHRFNALTGSSKIFLGADDHGHAMWDWSEPGEARVHWVIVGGESGANARPMHPQWARSLRDQCQAAGTPFFFKQNGAWQEVKAHRFGQPASTVRPLHRFGDGTVVWRVNKKGAGRELDGRTWDEYPEVAA